MYTQLINGKLIPGNGDQMTVYNPTDGNILAQYPGCTPEQAEEALQSADSAFKTWKNTSLNEREVLIRKFIDVLNIHRDEIVALLMKETGKPLGNATYDFNMLPDCLNYFIEEAKRMNGEIIPDYDGKHLSFIRHKPLGVVVAHLAWNFPILNLGYKLGPILASGCTCVIKPSIVTPLATLRIAELAAEIFPAGVINVVSGSSSKIAPVLNGSDIPRMLTLIGSSETGKRIIHDSTSSVKRYSLELGGNAPAIVFKDADVRAAALMTADGKYGNAGQVCVSPNRVFVHKDVLDEFISVAKEYAENLILDCGDDTDHPMMGPLSTFDNVERMEGLVADALKKGGELVTGGKRVGRGYFFQPTMILGVTKEMRLYKEEVFGPIMSIIPFDDQDDIVALANDTEYGLAAYVYTKDLETALKMTDEIDSGSVCVNEPFYNYNLPHGGVKESGVGKDCSKWSLEEYYTVRRSAIRMA